MRKTLCGVVGLVVLVGAFNLFAWLDEQGADDHTVLWHNHLLEKRAAAAEVGEHGTRLAMAEPQTWGNAPEAAVESPQPALVAEPQLRPMKFREGLSLRQRREAGLTIRNIRRVVAAGQESGEITEDMTRAEVAIYVAGQLMADNPGAFQDPQFDWDAFLDFIERLLPLILQIISIFSYMPMDADWLTIDDVMGDWSQNVHCLWMLAEGYRLSRSVRRTWAREATSDVRMVT